MVMLVIKISTSHYFIMVIVVLKITKHVHKDHGLPYIHNQKISVERENDLSGWG